MNKMFKRIPVLLALTIPFSIFLPYIGLNLYDYITTDVVSEKQPLVIDKYQNAFDATCGIHTKNGNATGVLLNTGFILTAMHVVDNNKNGIVDMNEERIRVRFDSIASVHTGTIIYGSQKSDLAVVVIPNAPISNIRLMSNEDYEGVLAGAPLFAIGRSLGRDPPHFTKGIRSTDPSLIRVGALGTTSIAKSDF